MIAYYEALSAAYPWFATASMVVGVALAAWLSHVVLKYGVVRLLHRVLAAAMPQHSADIANHSIIARLASV